MNTPAYEHNGQPVAREAFYAIACDPRRSVAVEACAGAGKTWMLVSRMLRALLEGSAPHEILAITFTKKAAGEMRQRLQEWLQEFSGKPLPDLEKELIARGVSLQAARDKREQLQNLYRQTLEAGRPVQIRTFHSWFAALLSTAPLAVLEQQGLPAHYELLEDDAEAVREVWRPYLQAVADSPLLRAAYEECVARHGRSQTHKALEGALAKRVEFTLADEAGVVDASVEPVEALFPDLAGEGSPLQALVLREREALLAAALALGRASARTYSDKGVALEMAVTAQDGDGVAAALLTQKGEPRKFNDKLAGIEQVRHAQALCERALAARRQHEAWQHQRRMALLARALIAQFAQLKRERGWVDMNDVERTALVMLSDPVLSGWVQERLDTRVRHLLVDEFQDTNPLQWQALHAWLSGYAGTGGGQQAPSVFIVGDPKQSIYRFRRAEPQVFLAAQAFVREGLGGDLLACDHTRRNATGVIDAVNHAMLAAQAQGEYAGFRAHTTESADAGRLLCLPAITADDGGGAPPQDAPPAWRDSLTQPRHEAEETLRMRECAQAAQWVAAQIAAGVPAREIMVLARKRDRLAALQDALRAQHIPCVQPEKAELGDAPEVRDVVALLDALVSPGHDLSLARALKSPLFGVDDAALVQLALLRRHHENASWFDLLLQKRELLPLALQALGPDLMQYQQWVAAWPPHDALHAIYRHRDVLARYAAAAPATQRGGVLANLRALLAAALQQGGGRYLTPYAFVRAMKRPGTHAPGRVDAQAVRLLTIHGAKGLEAHSVLLLDTDARAQKAETMGALVDWPGERPVPRRFVFLASESSPPPSAAEVLALEQAERQREELNTLYVAMTRAKHCLALSCVQAASSSPGSWWNRLAPGMQAAPAPTAGDAPADRAAAAELAELPPYAAPDRPVAPDPQDISTPGTRLGEAMHQLLEQAGVAGAPLAALRAQGWPERRLAQLARDFDIAPQAARHAAVLAQRVLQGEGAWAWDAAQVERAFNEAPLVHQGQRLRLDRLVRRRAQAGRPAAWWVLDYKSAARPESQPQLQAQLRQYRAAVRGMVPGESVFAAFLTGDGRMVVVDDEAQGELF
ncbi:exodeoxyribonuclease V subunit beta [Acidovorax sp. MR-S7]|uniref:UvrD-helicase domain-containing protein n=1 Tax=Acidovorax sp. MR-S7 TaxID=1268622 RepID=UPI00036D1BCE|nr:UvrD-helicase domain-containing protein [Acidovorax sp. MR-S7]GAD23963.1 ATP-dependent exoDNAse (exonuclease V) beta subunit [Acidovorax sp. MR-S7]